MLNSLNTAGEKSCADNEHSNISTNKAEIDDVPGFIAIYKEFLEHFEDADPMYNQDSGYWKNRGEKDFKEDLDNKDRLYLLLKENAIIIGFIDARISKRPDDYVVKETGHIESVYIKPEHRKKGYGKLLIDKAMNWFKEKEVKRFTLGTYPSDISAKKFWEKMGFKEYLRMYRK